MGMPITAGLASFVSIGPPGGDLTWTVGPVWFGPP